MKHLYEPIFIRYLFIFISKNVLRNRLIKALKEINEKFII